MTTKEQAVILAAIMLQEAPADMLQRAMHRLMDAVADLQGEEEVYLVPPEVD